MNGHYLRTLLLLLLVPLVLALGWIMVVAWIASGLPVRGDNLIANTHKVAALLEFARSEPPGPYPKYTGPQDFFILGELRQGACWTTLQESLRRNPPPGYTLYTWQSPYQKREVDDSVVKVTFTDWTQVKLTFYQGTLVGCQRGYKLPELWLPILAHPR